MPPDSTWYNWDINGTWRPLYGPPAYAASSEQPRTCWRCGHYGGSFVHGLGRTYCVRCWQRITREGLRA